MVCESKLVFRSGDEEWPILDICRTSEAWSKDLSDMSDLVAQLVGSSCCLSICIFAGTNMASILFSLLGTNADLVRENRAACCSESFRA